MIITYDYWLIIIIINKLINRFINTLSKPYDFQLNFNYTSDMYFLINFNFFSEYQFINRFWVLNCWK